MEEMFNSDFDLTEQRSFYLQRLSFGDIVFRMQELLVLCKYLIDILKVC